MENLKNQESEFIEELKQRFGAEEEQYMPTDEELQFLEEREDLESELLWSFEKYEQNYELIKAYGLESKLINELEWFIVFELEHDKQKFLGSTFYQQFKYHEVVQRALLEYERKMELKR